MSNKRQRTSEQMAARETQTRDGRRGESVVGGKLRLDISSCLKPAEAEILGMMLEAVKLSKSGTVVRVAGGWVRDKLLGLENEDIDVAVDNCTGVAFANMVNAYLKSRGQNEGKVAVIEANPEQSKHLETARMKIKGIWVDLVNLRTEVYRSDSRIPEATLGTAEEDALRRDFTLNALFYNVNEGKVEDKTGRGVGDLRGGIIRTPLSPMITFQDDPLRVLRAIRFAARFGFTLHEDLRAAAQDSKIQAALSTKVSPERVGAELSGMITGKMAQPALALSLLQELGLAPAVYNPPDNLVPPPPEGGFDWARGTAVARAAARLLAVRSNTSRVLGERLPSAGAAQGADSTTECAERVTGKMGAVGVGTTESTPGAQTCDETRGGGGGGGGSNAEQEATVGVTTPEPGSRMGEKGEEVEISDDAIKVEAPATLVRELFLCAALLPLRGVKHKAKKGKLVPAALSVVGDSLKLKAKEAKHVADILELSQTFCSLADANMAGLGGDTRAAAEAKKGRDGEGRRDGAEFSRLSVGLAVREAKEMWPTCVDLSCAVEMCSREPPGSAPQVDADNKYEERSVIDKYEKFRNTVASMGLERAWDMAPLLRGNELVAELHLPKGPEIGKQMAKQISWQLEHPEGTREQCVAFLRAELEIHESS